MNQQILMLVLVVVVIGVISAGVMMSNSPETYTAASDFNPSKDIYIPGMKADGTIVLAHKFKDIDTAIDKAAGKIKTDYVAAVAGADTRRVAAINTYDAGIQQRKYVTMDNLGGNLTYWMKNSFDPRYVRKGVDYRLYMSTGNPAPGQNIVGHSAGGGRYNLGTDPRNLAQYFKIK